MLHDRNNLSSRSFVSSVVSSPSAEEYQADDPVLM